MKKQRTSYIQQRHPGFCDIILVTEGYQPTVSATLPEWLFSGRFSDKALNSALDSEKEFGGLLDTVTRFIDKPMVLIRIFDLWKVGYFMDSTSKVEDYYRLGQIAGEQNNLPLAMALFREAVGHEDRQELADNVMMGATKSNSLCIVKWIHANVKNLKNLLDRVETACLHSSFDCVKYLTSHMINEPNTNLLLSSVELWVKTSINYGCIKIAQYLNELYIPIGYKIPDVLLKPLKTRLVLENLSTLQTMEYVNMKLEYARREKELGFEEDPYLLDDIACGLAKSGSVDKLVELRKIQPDIAGNVVAWQLLKKHEHGCIGKKCSCVVSQPSRDSYLFGQEITYSKWFCVTAMVNAAARGYSEAITDLPRTCGHRVHGAELITKKQFDFIMRKCKFTEDQFNDFMDWYILLKRFDLIQIATKYYPEFSLKRPWIRYMCLGTDLQKVKEFFGNHQMKFKHGEAARHALLFGYKNVFETIVKDAGAMSLSALGFGDSPYMTQFVASHIDKFVVVVIVDGKPRCLSMKTRFKDKQHISKLDYDMEVAYIRQFKQN